MNELVILPAGNFSEWLRGAEASLQSGGGSIDVPCGVCTACCRSSMFIHIQPDENETIGRIPRKLLFPAPGWPKGHLLMGYNDKGHCPMLVNDRCSVYEHRPRTCRNYDCRVFAATGIAVDEKTQADIASRAKAWAFHYEEDGSRQEHDAVKSAAAFLENNRDLFRNGRLPDQPAQLATLAIKVHRIFSPKAKLPDTEIAQAIMRAMDQAGRDRDAADENR
jgi:Fe-S-cluster containining protein